MAVTTTTGRRSERLEARVPAELKDTFVRAAALRGQSLTDFIVSTVAEAAHRVLREQDVLELTRRDQLAFANSLTRPPEPSVQLQTAALAYRNRVGS